MEKKKKTIFFLIIVFIGIINLANKGRCSPYIIVWYFNTDKETYYYDEEIYINASWDLNYEVGQTSFIQIKILDNAWDLLWNSSLYSQKGSHLEGEWYINIEDLDLPFNNTSIDLIVAFYYYLNTGVITDGYAEVRYIQAIKRNISCELIDFKQNINYGDLLQFKARFYSSDDNINLTNHIINVKIVSNEGIHYTNNFTTNSSGMIEIIISNFENITIGIYNLIFEIYSDKFYTDSTFEYQLIIGSIRNDESGIESNNSETQENTTINFIPIIFSILSISVLGFLIFYHNNIKKAKQKDLADLTIKY